MTATQHLVLAVDAIAAFGKSAVNVSQVWGDMGQRRSADCMSVRPCGVRRMNDGSGEAEASFAARPWIRRSGVGMRNCEEFCGERIR
jgi:hypothetical protein